jgi:hypothetical protein
MQPHHALNTLFLPDDANNSVKIGVVKERKGPKTRPDQPNRFMQIIAMFQTDFMICGIAPFGDHLVLLAYVEEAG